MNVRFLPFVLLLVFSLAVFAADVPKTVINVLVTNQFDKPVENAEVILDFEGSRQMLRGGMKKKTLWEVHTNQEGKAHFPPIPEGTVQMQVNKQRYQTWGDKVELSGPEKTLNVKLLPPQSQYSAHEPLKQKEEPKK